MIGRKEETAQLAWWAITLIIIVVIAGVIGIGYGVVYVLRRNTSFGNSFKYKHIDEQTALAQNQAEMEAW